MSGGGANNQQPRAFVTAGSLTPAVTVTGRTTLGSSSCRLMSRRYAAGGVGVFNDEADDDESEGGGASGSTLDEWNDVDDDESEAIEFGGRRASEAAAGDAYQDQDQEDEEDQEDVDEDEDEESARAVRIEAAKKRMQEEEDKEPVTVLPGPVCDAFSALVLELRAGGHGVVPGSSMDDGYDGGEDRVTAAAKSSRSSATEDGASIEKISSWSNPEPWSTFSGLTEWQVKSSLGDVRRTLKVSFVFFKKGGKKYVHMHQRREMKAPPVNFFKRARVLVNFWIRSTHDIYSRTSMARTLPKLRVLLLKLVSRGSNVWVKRLYK